MATSPRQQLRGPTRPWVPGGQHDLLGSVLGRQLAGGAVYARPFLADLSVEGARSGAVLLDAGRGPSPPFALQYSTALGDRKLLAVGDEEGNVTVLDGGADAQPAASGAPGGRAAPPRAMWAAHRNAIFDLAWHAADARLLTASGDQTARLWDTAYAERLGTFHGHAASIKAVAPAPAGAGCPHVFATGARDGCVLVWDDRVSTRTTLRGREGTPPVMAMKFPHAPRAGGGGGAGGGGPLADRAPGGRRGERRAAAAAGEFGNPPSVTSAVFVDGGTLATGGVDGVINFWDLRAAAAGPAAEVVAAAAAAGAAAAAARRRGAPVDGGPAAWLGGLPAPPLLAASALPPLSAKRRHGITSLSLHPGGGRLLASLTGGHLLLYDVARPEAGPLRWFGGHTVGSFYVKAAFSCDGSHVVSGSTDRRVYVWQAEGRGAAAAAGAPAAVLAGHAGEVTCVAWCPSDFCQVASGADDATVRLWNVARAAPEEEAPPPRRARAPPGARRARAGADADGLPGAPVPPPLEPAAHAPRPEGGVTPVAAAAASELHVHSTGGRAGGSTGTGGQRMRVGNALLRAAAAAAHRVRIPRQQSIAAWVHAGGGAPGATPAGGGGAAGKAAAAAAPPAGVAGGGEDRAAEDEGTRGAGEDAGRTVSSPVRAAGRKRGRE